MNASDSHGNLININSFVRYAGTGTVGKAIDIKNEDDVDWVKIDKTSLWYDSSTLAIVDENKYDKYGENDDNPTKEDIIDQTKKAQENFGEIELGDNVGEGGG